MLILWACLFRQLFCFWLLNGWLFYLDSCLCGWLFVVLVYVLFCVCVRLGLLLLWFDLLLSHVLICWCLFVVICLFLVIGLTWFRFVIRFCNFVGSWLFGFDCGLVRVAVWLLAVICVWLVGFGLFVVWCWLFCCLTVLVFVAFCYFVIDWLSFWVKLVIFTVCFCLFSL